MPITVEDPDGTQHSFADGTPTASINSEMERRWAARSNPQPQPRPLQQPGMMPPGVNPGSFSAKTGSNLEAEMVPLSAEAQRGMRMVAAGGATNNRNLEQAGRMILEKDPTYQARTKQSHAIGEAAGQRQTARLAGENILSSYAKLLHSFNETPDEVLNSAIGPRNTAEIDPISPTYVPGSRSFGWQGIPIPGLSGPTTIDPKTGAPIANKMSTVERAALLNPNDEATQKAWNAQNLFGHDVHGITNAMAASAAKGVRMTDQRQAMFDSAMRDFTKATSRKDAMEILDHAKSIIQNDFNLTPKEADDIVQSNLARVAQEAQHKSLLKAAASVPPTAVHELLNSNADPSYIRSFNKHFYGGKPGLAERLLESHYVGSPQ